MVSANSSRSTSRKSVSRTVRPTSVSLFTSHFQGRRCKLAETDTSASSADSPLVPGHITSNEPGFYEEGSFGIRLESVLVVKEVKTRRQFGDRQWFGFERLTMASPPICSPQSSPTLCAI